ncbi:MAG: FAD-dependent oxidoreductase [Bacillota bacterium]|nr:FAD-dependent oxidoreductase [Bacillota bacterium]
MFPNINNVSESEEPKTRIVIIGGGIAGVSAADELRRRSQGTDITILSKETQLPYYRVNLTRYLAGEINEDKLPIHPEKWYEENKIKLKLGIEVQGIDRENKRVLLSTGDVLEYDRLIIAAGAKPYIPEIKGSSLANIVTVRNIHDAKYIMEKLKEYHSCICIGGGILGLETAGSIAKRGLGVTLLINSEWLMPLQLNKKAGLLVKKHMNEIGVQIRENSNVVEIMGEKCCEGVKLENGETLESKLVIITAGVKPDLNILKDTGLEMENGLIVNDRMQTSDHFIYAAGDISEHRGITYGLWSVAMNQGKTAALNILGISTEFPGLPRSYLLKVLGVEMFSIGEIDTDEDCSIYEKETEKEYYMFAIKYGRIIGSILVGDITLSTRVKKAVENEVVFPPDVLENIESIMKKLKEM